jgi:hypothetical protein
MSDFRWDIEDVSDTETLVFDTGEELKLDDLGVVSASGWAIQESDKTVAIEPVQGGAVEKFDASKEVDNTPTPAQSKGAVSVVNLVFGLGFLAVLISDIYHGTINLQTYMMIVAAFIVGSTGNSKK